MSGDRISDLAVSIAELRTVIEPLGTVPERLVRVEERVANLTTTDNVLFDKMSEIEKNTRGPDWRILTPAVVTALAALAMLAERVAKHF